MPTVRRFSSLTSRHLTFQCSVDRSTDFSVARLPKSCKIIEQQAKMRNIDLNRVLGNDIN